MTKTLIGLAAVCALVGCSEPAGPIDLDTGYTLISAAGNTLPWRGYQIYEQSGCTADLLGATITFSDFGQYSASLTTQLTCADGLHPRSHTLNRGRYTRDGDTISLAPDVSTTFTLGTVVIRSSGLDAVLSTSGRQYQLVFRRGI